MNSRSQHSLKGFLPEHTFVMAKKRAVQNQKLNQSNIEVQSGADQKNSESASTLLRNVGLKTSIVSEGSTESALVFVLQGKPFEGKAGQLLQKMIQAMGVRHTSVLMVSIQNETTLAELSEFVKQAKVVVALGAPVAQKLLESESGLSGLRANLHPFLGSKLVATYTAQELIENPSLKKDAWEDLKLAVQELGWKLPNKGA